MPVRVASAELEVLTAMVKQLPNSSVQKYFFNLQIFAQAKLIQHNCRNVAVVYLAEICILPVPLGGSVLPPFFGLTLETFERV